MRQPLAIMTRIASAFSQWVMRTTSGWMTMPRWSRTAPGPYMLAAAALHEFQRGLEKRQLGLVLRRVGAVDLHPFLRHRQPGGLEWADVGAAELQLARLGRRQSQSHAAARDAGEHAVADEVRVKAVDLAGADPGKLEQHGVDVRLEAVLLNGAALCGCPRWSRACALGRGSRSLRGAGRRPG